MNPHPILDSLKPVLEHPTHVGISTCKVREVAGWMAYEDLTWPDFQTAVYLEGQDEDVMDFVFLASATNFAFTDFSTGEVFRAEYQGQEWWDADAMMACLKRAFEEGIPIFEGEYLAGLDRDRLCQIFRGNIEIPLLEERLKIYQQIGLTLLHSYQGRFHHFLGPRPHFLYSRREGLLDRLAQSFPSFKDSSHYDGQEIFFAKRAQLLFWILHARFHSSGIFSLDDFEEVTAFADYILPVALRLLGILEYSPALDERIRAREMIPAGSRMEVELRASTIWAVHLLTAAINRLRPKDLQIIDPVIDARLWSHYHRTHALHHLTLTTAY